MEVNLEIPSELLKPVLCIWPCRISNSTNCLGCETFCSHNLLTWPSGSFNRNKGALWEDWKLCEGTGEAGAVWCASVFKVPHKGGMYGGAFWLPACQGPLCKSRLMPSYLCWFAISNRAWLNQYLISIIPSSDTALFIGRSQTILLRRSVSLSPFY